MSDEKIKRITPNVPRSGNLTFARSQHPDALAAKVGEGVRRLPSVDASGPMMQATVAPGRTVHAPHPTEKACAGYDLEAKNHVMVPRQIVHKPGSVIELPASEVERLIELGFLIDPSVSPLT